jgi:hypothetical protein
MSGYVRLGTGALTPLQGMTLDDGECSLKDLQQNSETFSATVGGLKFLYCF